MIDLATMALAAITLDGAAVDRAVHPDQRALLALSAQQIAYSVFDAALVACVLQFALMRPRRWADRLLLDRRARYVAGDVSWNWMSLTGQYADGSLPDTGWVIGPLLMSLGACIRRCARAAASACHG